MEIVVAHFSVLSQHFPGEMEEALNISNMIYTGLVSSCCKPKLFIRTATGKSAPLQSKVKLSL
jgi:hypothetical protein